VQRFTVAFNFLCVLLGLLYEGRHLSLSVRRKITANVFLFNVYFCHVFMLFNVFLFLGERFFIDASNTNFVYQNLVLVADC